MKIKSIEWKNFGSYGNNAQNISFDENQGNFFLVLGGNGAGKSTMSDVIKFGLYGKVDSKKLRDLPNRFNGNMHIKIIVEKNPGTVATIERGLSPSYLKVAVNGVDYDQAGKKNIQEFIEEEILGIPYYVFNNMVSLSVNDFKSFINMGVNDKRMIIDRLFGLEVLGAIKWKVRYQIKSMKEQIDIIDSEISVIERNVASSSSELAVLNEKLKTASAEKKKSYASKIEKLKEFLSNAQSRLAEIYEKEKQVSDTISNWNDMLSDHKTEIHVCQEKIRLYENGKCPTCEGDLTTDHHKSLLKDYLQRSEESKTAVDSINVSLAQLRERKEKIRIAFNDLNTKKSSASTQMDNYTVELKKMSGDISDEQTKSLQNIIDENVRTKDTAIKRKTTEEKKVNFYKIIEEIFGDKGVKISAIKRILPVLNAEIKKVLQELGMDYRVMFNEEFEVDIQHLGFSVSPEQLSTGERKKVDFAALIALIRLMKSKFAGLNLIFLDEIFSSIDSDGIHHILKVLHNTCRELNLNIFVINHSQLPTEIFDYRVEISKNSGFSNLSIEKIG
jgi:DNA repair exonuclease SbcCD ATPase subunit